jgi:hypothetical protein
VPQALWRFGRVGLGGGIGIGARALSRAIVDKLAWGAHSTSAAEVEADVMYCTAEQKLPPTRRTREKREKAFAILTKIDASE